MFAEAHPCQRGGVELHPEHRQMQPRPLVGVEGLEALDDRFVGLQGVGRLRLRAPRIPRLPDGGERLPARRVLSAQAGIEEEAEDLRLGAEMRQHLGDRPLRVVGHLLQRLDVERLGEGAEGIVRATQSFDPRAGGGFHVRSPFWLGGDPAGEVAGGRMLIALPAAVGHAGSSKDTRRQATGGARRRGSRLLSIANAAVVPVTAEQARRSFSDLTVR